MIEKITNPRLKKTPDWVRMPKQPEFKTLTPAEGQTFMEELLNTELGSLMAEVQDADQIDRALELANEFASEVKGESLAMILSALFWTVIEMEANISRVVLPNETKVSIVELVSKFKERPRIPAILRKGARTTMTKKMSAALKAWKVAYRARVRLSGINPMALHAAVFGDITTMKVEADSSLSQKDLESMWYACFYVMFVSENEQDADRVPCSGDHGITLFNAGTVGQAETVWGIALQNHQEKARNEMEKTA
jgi:hypothetical protein